jgi:hypothetical protein
MNKLVFIAMVSCGVTSAFSQGLVYFSNKVASGGIGAQGPIIAPIYGIDPADPLVPKTGMPSIAYPSGTTVYGGTPLSGTGFTAQLWGGPVGALEDELQLCLTAGGIASASFRTGGSRGFIVPLREHVAVPNAPPGPGSRAVLQMRVWENMGGTITSWGQVLESPLVPRGVSPLFTPDFDLGDNSTLPPYLIGLQSFSLFIIPEPSAGLLLLGCGGVSWLWSGAFWRRDQKRQLSASTPAKNAHEGSVRPATTAGLLPCCA